MGPTEYDIKLHFIVSDSILELPFASTLQDSFLHYTVAASHFSREPLSYTEHDLSLLFRILRIDTSFRQIRMHPIMLSNVITHTFTHSSIALYSPVFSLANVLFVSFSLVLF